MGVIKRQGIKQSIVTYAGVAVGAVNVFILYPLALSKTEWGFLQFLTSAGKILTPFVMLGTLYLNNRFFPFFNDREKGHHGFLFFLLAVALAGNLVFGLLYFLFEDTFLAYFDGRSPLVRQYGRYLLPWLLFLSLGMVLTRYAFNFKRIVVPAILNDLLVKVGVPVLALLYFWGIFSYTGFLEGVVLLHLGILVALTLYIARLGQLFLRPRFGSRFDKKMIRDLGAYAGFGLLGSLGSTIVPQIDTFMIGAMLSFSNAAIYTIPNFVTNAIDVPRRAIANISTPILAEAWKNNDLEKVRELYQKTSLNQLVIGLFLLLCVWYSIDDLYLLMPASADREGYMAGKYIVLILGASKVVDMASGVNSEIIGASKYYRFNFVSIVILAFFTVLTNWLLIPRWGIEGAAVATLLSFTIFNVAKFIYLWGRLSMQPFSRGTLQVLAVGLVTVGLEMLIELPFAPLINIGLRSFLILLVFGGLTYLWRISPDINEMADQAWREVRKKFFRKEG